MAEHEDPIILPAKTDRRYLGVNTDLKPVFREEYNNYKEVVNKDLNLNENFFPKILFRNRNRLLSVASHYLFAL